MEKQGFAVFNPQNSLEQCIQNCYHQKYNRWLSQNEIYCFIDSLLDFDSFFCNYTNFSKIINQKILETKNDANYFYIPIHTLELRQVLKNKKLTKNRCIGGGSQKIVQQFFSEYPCFLVIDADVNEPKYSFNGWAVWNEEIDLSQGLIRITSLERVDNQFFEKIKNIINDESKEIGLFTITETPGIGFSKAASKQFVVNISALDIDDTLVTEDSPEEAVEWVLDRKWEKTKNPHKDPKFTVEYWKNNEFWPTIVKEAALNQIQLNEIEKKIFDFIIYVNDKYELGLTFRCAGGWIRDKMLGKDSDDIDIAIDKMTGSQFGEYLQKELGKSGNVIKANPDQSKHLETMTINIFGQDIDFVNLRSESYGDSRIPEMQFGDAQTDALRRDLTINALFYNINSGQVEDFTGKGIEDLENMVLRTPLDPVKTFIDDPLRILRLLRFYSRYKGSTIDSTALEAMKNPEVQKALKEKISPERVLKEWKKMFAGPQISQALKILHDTDIWDNVLKIDKMKDFKPFTMDQNNPHHIDNVLEHTLKVVEEYRKILEADNAGDDEKALLLTAAFFHDLGKLDPSIIGIKETVNGIHNTYHGHEDVSAQVAHSILEGLKASNEDIKLVEQIVASHMVFHNKIEDKKLRKLIRELGRNIVIRIIQHAKADAVSKPGANTAHYDELLNRTQTIEPSTIENKKNPPVDGNTLMKIFPNIKPSTGYIKYIQNYLQELKDENPSLSKENLLEKVYTIKNFIELNYGNKNSNSWYRKIKD